MDLVVKSPFDGRAIGERITDPGMVEAIRADHRAEFVVQVAPLEAPPMPVPPAEEH